MGHPVDCRGRIVGELLIGRKYGHQLHFWELRHRRHEQEVDIGDEHQMVLELRPAHDTTKAYGFIGVVVSVADLPGGVCAWLAKRDVPAAGDGLAFDERFFPQGAAWRGLRPHQVRLQGGDASSDSYCYP